MHSPSPNKQKGMTAIGWMLILAMAGVYAYILIILIPVYLEGFEISSSMESMVTDSSAHGKGPRELKSMLLKRLDINSIYDIKEDDINITRDPAGGYGIEIDYEPRVHLFGNIYMIIVFDKSVVVPTS
jgi:hypothetical protein